MVGFRLTQPVLAHLAAGGSRSSMVERSMPVLIVIEMLPFLNG